MAAAQLNSGAIFKEGLKDRTRKWGFVKGAGRDVNFPSRRLHCRRKTCAVDVGRYSLSLNRTKGFFPSPIVRRKKFVCSSTDSWLSSDYDVPVEGAIVEAGYANVDNQDAALSSSNGGIG